MVRFVPKTTRTVINSCIMLSSNAHFAYCKLLEHYGIMVFSSLLQQLDGAHPRQAMAVCWYLAKM